MSRRRNTSNSGGLGVLIGVLFLVGLIIKFIWWIVGALALVAACYVIRAVVRQGNAAAAARNQRMADHVQVANRVQHLVLHEFVVVAQALGIEHAVVVDHDRVVHAAAQRQPA